MTEGAMTAMQYTRGSGKGQAEDGSRLRQQIESLLGWPEAEVHEVPLSVEPCGSGRSPNNA